MARTPAVSGQPESHRLGLTRGATVGLALGPLLAAAIWLVPAPAGLSPEAWRVVGLGAWMVTWWISETIPLGVTALLPIPLLPILGAGDLGQATAPFANPIIFLFLGGFLIAIAVERWRLHERIAFTTARFVGTGSQRTVAGFMLATALLSMWISNTAATLLMLPMGLSIVALLPSEHPDRDRFRQALLLGIAYAATIGGLGTLIGTPPNAFLAAYARDHLEQGIGFAQWMLVAVPLAAVGLVLSWLLLTRVLLRVRMKEIPGGSRLIADRLAALGPLSTPEFRVAAVFAFVAVGWVLASLLGDRLPVSDPAIAILGATLLFLVPAGAPAAAPRPLLVWEDTLRLPWQVLLLFGGGLSLAGAMQRTGLADWIGDRLVFLDGMPLVVLVLGVATVVLLLTELVSNTAVAATFFPVLAALADRLGHDAMVLLVPAALAASCAFMLPVGTPPNAIAVATGHVRPRHLLRAGVWLNLLFLGLVTVHAMTLARLLA